MRYHLDHLTPYSTLPQHYLLIVLEGHDIVGELRCVGDKWEVMPWLYGYLPFFKQYGATPRDALRAFTEIADMCIPEGDDDG